MRYITILILSTALLFLANILFGSVSIPADAVINILLGNESEKASWNYIVVESRLPQAITALLSGMALSVSGLMLQTASQGVDYCGFLFRFESHPFCHVASL